MNMIVKNTLSNYFCFALKAISGFVITRILFDGLGQDEYGFWVLLWSIYGYTLLLDFGLGWSIQKSAAEFVKSNDKSKLMSQVSSVFFSYLVISILIIFSSLMLAYFPGQKIFEILNTPKYLYTFLIFSISTACIFPTGIFSEVLVGLGHIYIRNYIRIFFLISNLIGVVCMSIYGLDLCILTIFSVLNHLVSNVLLYLCVKKRVSNFHITPSLVCIKEMKRLSQFSFHAYIIIFTNLILYNSDQLVLGGILGTGAVGIYHLGTRLSFFMKTVNEQFQENVFPYTVSSKTSGLRESFLISGNKLVSFISNISFPFLFIFSEEIVALWLGHAQVEVVLITRISLLYSLLSTVFKSLNNSFLMGDGRSSVVVRFSLIEVILNVVLTIIMIQYIGVLGAVAASLISLVLVLFFYVPFVISIVELSVSDWYKKVLKRNNVALLFNLVGLSVLKIFVIPMNGIFFLLSVGVLFSVFYLWFFLFYIWSEEEFDLYLKNNRFASLLKSFSIQW